MRKNEKAEYQDNWKDYALATIAIALLLGLAYYMGASVRPVGR